MNRYVSGLLAIFFLSLCTQGNAQTSPKPLPALKVAPGGRYFTASGSKPFFWLGDTGWLLFIKLNRAETIAYLDKRQKQGFNVIQVMVLHDVRKAVNRYGDSALAFQDPSRPLVTEGSDPGDSIAYDFWDHVDFVVDAAAQRGLYMALVPVWGTNVKNGWVSRDAARSYAEFLAKRYRNKSNIVWLNGGDIPGSDSTATWNTIGHTLNQIDTTHLITFHPRGRTTSSRWFHEQPWLDFNMFQSGHRNYAQDTSRGETHYGEDNWRYINEDFSRGGTKPTLDGEPSYEGIPHGLHDTTQPYWNDADLRRYAYWSVLSGGAGFTYGHNAVMQFFRPEDDGSAYGAKKFWWPALSDPGAAQMIHVKSLVLSGSFPDLRPDTAMVVNNGERYERVVAARGRNYVYAYTYTGRTFRLRLGMLSGSRLKAAWYDPRTGRRQPAGTIANSGEHTFDPPGTQKEGNDWVLILQTENHAKKK